MNLSPTLATQQDATTYTVNATMNTAATKTAQDVTKAQQALPWAI